MPAAPDIRVRDARDDERAAVSDLTLRAYAEYGAAMTPSAWTALDGAVHAALDSDAEMHRIVAECGGGLVGSVLLFPAAADAYGDLTSRMRWPEVRLLAVPPEARGLGVGRVLMDECVRRARAMGAAELGLHTSASMRAAISLYRRMGFERAPEFDFQPPGAELVEAYRLHLGAAAPTEDGASG